jgi:hypothetical protein
VDWYEFVTAAAAIVTVVWGIVALVRVVRRRPWRRRERYSLRP